MNDSQAAPEDEVDLMKEIISLCKQRGFIFQSSEIYGGLKSCYDYGPLGAQLKKNLRDAWWQDVVLTPPVGPDGREVSIVGLDTCIIQNPKVASLNVNGAAWRTSFNSPWCQCADRLSVKSVEMVG